MKNLALKTFGVIVFSIAATLLIFAIVNTLNLI